MTCTVVTAGSSGSWGCTGRTEVVDGAGVSHVSISAAQPGANLTLAQTIQFTVTFSTASTTNSAAQNNLTVEQLN